MSTEGVSVCRRRRVYIAVAVVTIAAAVVGGILGYQAGKKPRKRNKVSVLSYGNQPAFMGPAPGKALLDTAFLSAEDILSMRTSSPPSFSGGDQEPTSANTTTTTGTTTSTTTNLRNNASPPTSSSASAAPRSFFSTLFSKLTGQETQDELGEEDDDSPHLFDKDLFDDSVLDKVSIPGRWKALDQINPLNKAQSLNPHSPPNPITCFPRNGSEIEKAVMGSSCTLIMLNRTYFEPYRLNNVLMVNSTKFIIGNPLRLPAIIPHKKQERIFHVVAGGYLVIQSVALFRGAGRRVGPDKFMKISQGATGLVELGGSFHAIGVWFREESQTLSNFLDGLNNTINGRGNVRTFGGHVMVKGGTLRLTGCVTFNNRPYGNPTFNSVSIGGDYLVVGGSVVIVGSWQVTYNLFIATQMVGNPISVLLGNLIWIGGGQAGATGLQQQAGVGFFLHVGAGVMVTVGVVRGTVTGCQSRCGGTVFHVNAGVMVKIGFTQMTTFGVRQLATIGTWSAVVTGTFVNIGGSQGSVAGAQVHFGTGVNHNGAGSITFIAHPLYRAQIVQSNYGAGTGRGYNGGGSTVEVAIPQFASRVCTCNMCAASENFLGGGDMVILYNERLTAHLVSFFTGVGEQVYVGGGIGVFAHNMQQTYRLLSYSTWPYTYTVGGYGAGRTAAFGILILPNQGTRVKTPKPLRQMEVPELSQRRNKLIVQGDRFYETKVSFKHLSEVQQSQETVPLFGRGARSPYDIVAALGASGRASVAAKEDIPTGKIYITNDTDCVACGLQPGLTQDHLAALPHQCVPSDTCGANLTETLSIAATTAATQEQQDSIEGLKEGLKDKMAMYEKFAHLAEYVEDSRTGRRRLRHLMEDGSFDPNVLPGVFILSGTLTVYCNYRDDSRNSDGITTNCTSEQVAKAILQDFITSPLKGHADISVAEQKVLPFLVDQVDPLYWEERRPQSLPGCDGYTNFGVYLTTVDEQVFKEACRLYDTLQRDTQGLALELEDKTASPTTQICGAKLMDKEALSVPHYNRQGTYDPTAMVSPGITVATDGDPVPTASIYPKDSYLVFAYNFPKGSTVTIHLLDSTSRVVPKSMFPPIRLRDFDDATPTPTAVTWTVSEDLPLGKYYFRATTLGIITYSQALSLQAPGTPKRRHLLG